METDKSPALFVEFTILLGALTSTSLIEAKIMLKPKAFLVARLDYWLRSLWKVNRKP